MKLKTLALFIFTTSAAFAEPSANKTNYRLFAKCGFDEKLIQAGSPFIYFLKNERSEIFVINSIAYKNEALASKSMDLMGEMAPIPAQLSADGNRVDWTQPALTRSDLPSPKGISLYLNTAEPNKVFDALGVSAFTNHAYPYCIVF